MTENVRNGLSTGVLIFLVYCFLQTRDGLMVMCRRCLYYGLDVPQMVCGLMHLPFVLWK